MTELLRRNVAQIALLPAEQQDAIAEAMRHEWEAPAWDDLVSRPDSRRFLDRLVGEARREDDAGASGER